jgi:RimJ/RimL family protein N-acetyltransferase
VVPALVARAWRDWTWQRLEWRADIRNAGSMALARKVGFHLDGVLRSNAVDRRGERYDTAVWSVVRPCVDRKHDTR